jgi:hypothetical protein
MSESGNSVASAMFFVPTAPQSMHWYNLKPSGISIASSHKNSVSRLQPLHLNLVGFVIINQFVAFETCAILKDSIIIANLAFDN